MAILIAELGHAYIYSPGHSNCTRKYGQCTLVAGLADVPETTTMPAK